MMRVAVSLITALPLLLFGVHWLVVTFSGAYGKTTNAPTGPVAASVPPLVIFSIAGGSIMTSVISSMLRRQPPRPAPAVDRRH